jgi:hypothetical protein
MARRPDDRVVDEDPRREEPVEWPAADAADYAEYLEYMEGEEVEL